MLKPELAFRKASLGGKSILSSIPGLKGPPAGGTAENAEARWSLRQAKFGIGKPKPK